MSTLWKHAFGFLNKPPSKLHKSLQELLLVEFSVVADEDEVVVPDFQLLGVHVGRFLEEDDVLCCQLALRLTHAPSAEEIFIRRKNFKSEPFWPM